MSDYQSLLNTVLFLAYLIYACGFTFFSFKFTYKKQLQKISPKPLTIKKATQILNTVTDKQEYTLSLFSKCTSAISTYADSPFTYILRTRCNMLFEDSNSDRNFDVLRKLVDEPISGSGFDVILYVAIRHFLCAVVVGDEFDCEVMGNLCLRMLNFDGYYKEQRDYDNKLLMLEVIADAEYELFGK